MKTGWLIPVSAVSGWGPYLAMFPPFTITDGVWQASALVVCGIIAGVVQVVLQGAAEWRATRAHDRQVAQAEKERLRAAGRLTPDPDSEPGFPMAAEPELRRELDRQQRERDRDGTG